MWNVYAAYDNEDAYTDGDWRDHFTWKRLVSNISTKAEANDIARLIAETDWDIVRTVVSKNSLKKIIKEN